MIQRSKKFFVTLGTFMVFMGDTFRHFPENIRHPGETLKHVWDIGVKSVPIVFMTGFFVGMILGLQLGESLEHFIVGTAQFVGGALSLSIFRELGPVLTSLIVVSRVCSSVTAQLGTMRVTEQIDALSTMSKDPMGYLVAPRVLAGMISLPVLGYISIFVSMVGGWLMMTLVNGVNSSTYWEWAQIPLDVINVVEGGVKLLIMGAMILLIATYYGFNTKGGADGVGKATISSVVTSSFMVILVDYIIGSIFIML